MRSVLVTGASGFVGVALCERLLAAGWLVRGTVRSECRSNADRPAAELITITNVDSATDWSTALSGIDTVVHLAARVHVADVSSADTLEKFRMTNVDGTVRLARQAASMGVRRLVFMSSVKVNGEGQESPYTEETPPAPQDPYGISKREAEDALWDISAETGLEIVVIRSPLVYGPGVKANFLALMKLADRGFPLPFRWVNNQRSLVYVGNLVDAISVCIDNQRAAGRTYLVSDGEDVSTPELIRRIASALHTGAFLLPIPPMLLELGGTLSGTTRTIRRLLESLTVDSSKIRTELSWTPPFSMEQGLKETAEWFKKTKKPVPSC